MSPQFHHRMPIRPSTMARRMDWRARGASWTRRNPGSKTLEVEKLKDNLYVLKGGGGNTAVFVTSTGVVVVDAKNPGWGQPILDAVKKLTDKPITTLINTHTHGDHVSGNVEFPATVDIVVQENTKTNMMKMIPNSTAQDQTVPAQTIFQQNGGKGLPKRTFKDRLTLFSGPDEVDLYYFGRGHTNGDAWVVFPTLRVVHSGDIFSGKSVPLIDTSNGGSLLHISDSLKKAHDGIKNVDIVNELSLPPVKIHCSVLAEDAIKAAVNDYRNKHSA